MAGEQRRERLGRRDIGAVAERVGPSACARIDAGAGVEIGDHDPRPARPARAPSSGRSASAPVTTQTLPSSANITVLPGRAYGELAKHRLDRRAAQRPGQASARRGRDSGRNLA